MPTYRTSYSSGSSAPLPGHLLLRAPFDSINPLTPKAQEVAQDASKRVDAQVKDRASFQQAVARAFAEGRRVLRADDVSAVVFAHKTRPLRAGRRCWLA